MADNVKRTFCLAARGENRGRPEVKYILYHKQKKADIGRTIAMNLLPIICRYHYIQATNGVSIEEYFTPTCLSVWELSASELQEITFLPDIWLWNRNWAIKDSNCTDTTNWCLCQRQTY